MDLSSAKTCELVAELRKRDGVEVNIVDPYEDMQSIYSALTEKIRTYLC